MRVTVSVLDCWCLLFVGFGISIVSAVSVDGAELSFPPKLPGGATLATDTSDAFLKGPADMPLGVEIAKTAPTVDFMYYPEQTYLGTPWSVWGDSLAADGKYYSAIGDHGKPQGNAFVYEYNPKTKRLRTVVDVNKLLGLPEGHYVPSKIHSRIDMGSDGCLYFATHRGGTRITTDEYHYKGDWIIRHDPKTSKTEIVAYAPVSKHCIPTSVLDPDRLIFYGGTAAGNRTDPDQFFAYDIRKRKVLHAVENGPYRYLIFAKSTGRVYYVSKDEGPLMRYDPSDGKPPTQIPGKIGMRSATQETADGYVYTVSTRGDGTLWRFNTKTEEIDRIGEAAVASRTYVTSLDVDPTGRFLYYSCGAHGGGQNDGTPIVQFDVKTRKKKIIAFLHPFYLEKYGYTALGTFGSAISEDGSKLYVTWNGNRGGADKRGRVGFDTCALTVIHIPESERQP
jgi:hypothetical protein